MKRFLFLFLALLSYVISVHAQSFEGNGISYNVTKSPDGESPGEVEVIQSLSNGDGESGGYTGDIVIPADVKYEDITYKVTRIGRWSFRLCPDLLSISIPDGVTYIGDAAFFGCSSLTTVTIPNSVITIEGPAFGECSSLTSVVFGDQLVTIGEQAFISCSKLSSITIPSSVTSIGKYAFLDCNNLESILVDNENTVYDSRDNCDAIIETNSGKLIVGCNNTVIPNGVTCIGEAAFKGCSNLISVKFGKNLSSIENEAFDGCSSLSSLTLPKKLKSIGNRAFRNTPITAIAVSGSVNTIGSDAFCGCRELALVSFELDEDGNTSLTSIGNDAFRGCSFTSIIIPNSVTTIGSGVFAGNDKLQSATLGDAVTVIKDETFSYCRALSSVTIPDGVISIGNYAFADCNALTSVKMPKSLASMGDLVFDNCI